MEENLSGTDNDGLNSDSESSMYESAAQVQSTQNMERDLLLVIFLP